MLYALISFMAHLILMQVRIFDLNSHHGTFIVKIGQTVPYRVPPGTMFTLDDGDTLTFGKAVDREKLVQPVSVRVHFEYAHDQEPIRPFRFGFTSHEDGASEMSISDDEESSSNDQSSVFMDEHLDKVVPEPSPAAIAHPSIFHVTPGATRPLPPIQGLLQSLPKCIPFPSTSALRLPQIRDFLPRLTTPTPMTEQASNPVNISLPSPPSFAPMSPAPARDQCHSAGSQIAHHTLRATQSVTTFEFDSPLPSPRPSPVRNLGSVRLRREDRLAYHQPSESESSSVEPDELPAPSVVEPPAVAATEAATDVVSTNSQVHVQLQSNQLEAITTTLSRIEAQLEPMSEGSTRLHNSLTHNSEHGEELLFLVRNMQAEEQRRRQEFKEIMETARTAVVECQRYTQEVASSITANSFHSSPTTFQTSRKRAREEAQDAAELHEHSSRRRRIEGAIRWVTSAALSAPVVAFGMWSWLGHE